MKCPTLASLSVSSYSKSKKKREKQDQALVHWVDVCPVQQGMEEVMPQTPSSSLFVFLSVPRRIFLNINKAERFSQFFLFDLTALAQEIYLALQSLRKPIGWKDQSITLFRMNERSNFSFHWCNHNGKRWWGSLPLNMVKQLMRFQLAMGLGCLRAELLELPTDWEPLRVELGTSPL